MSSSSRATDGTDALRRALLAFWDAGHRALPWRATRDPWAILVSEIMLQQTTVAAAIPYWERFLRRWPRPADLARATRHELLSEWAGLGYYRRAGFLHEAACRVAEGGGALPATHDELLALPGVGRYTAAAVASIAYGEPVAAIDGNVERVLCRLFALGGDPRSAATAGNLRAHASALLDRRRPGDWNQALMELGATVCRPVAPACPSCPWRGSCAARAAGEVERYPELRKRASPVPVLRAALVASRGGRVLLARRASAPNEGFLELPFVEAPAGAAWIGGPREERKLSELLVAGLADAHGLALRIGPALPALRHSITHHRIRVQPFIALAVTGRARQPLLWMAPGAPDTPLTTASRRILVAAQPALLATAPEHFP
ncbi:MAG TPA: A/G-specific adenine glycosylase [Planctomycetota bacterium]|nr:A/G-specific adenine glycosylase [Planctomycetota bacterium]